MHEILMQEAQDFPITPFKPNSFKSDPSFDVGVTQSVEYWRSLAGSPFDSSDSDSSSDCEDDAMSLGSSDLYSTTREVPFSGDVSLISEGIGSLNIMESNALGLIFLYKEDILATGAVATSAQQAKGLRAPRNHQDDRSCGRPNQEYHAQQEHAVFQSDGPTDETLVRGFPQDIGLWADVSDDSGPKVFQGLGPPFQPDTYDHNLRAPRMKRISLPEEEYDEDLLYSGPALGGWLTGTLDGIPKTMPGLSGLDFDFPMPFAVEG